MQHANIYQIVRYFFFMMTLIVFATNTKYLRHVIARQVSKYILQKIPLY